MRARFVAAAVVSAAALIGASALGTGANAASSGSAAAKGITKSLASSYHGTASQKATPAKGKKGKCKTKFGTELPTVDGIISWGGAGFNDAGAADFKCKKATTIKKVEAYGYDGSSTGTDAFNVAFYANDPFAAAGNPVSDEPNDTVAAVCSYAGLPGASNGVYPAHVLTILTLTGGGCKLGKGSYWVSIQNTDSSTPWYWEMVSNQTGAAPDWRDVAGSFGTTCFTYDGGLTGGGGTASGTNGGDEYLGTVGPNGVNNTNGCLGYPYNDWDFMLK